MYCRARPEGIGRSVQRRERVRSWARIVSRREESVTGSMIVALEGEVSNLLIRRGGRTKEAHQRSSSV